MVLIIQYIIGFALLAFALFNSMLAFNGGGLENLFNLFIAMGAGLASFIFLKDLWFAPIVNRIEKVFYPDGIDTGTDFSKVDSLIYKKDFQGALALIDEDVLNSKFASKAYYKKCQILHDYLQDIDQTLVVAYERLNSEKLVSEDERLIFLVLDILDESEKQAALDLIKMLKLKINDDKILQRLKLRQQTLKA
ncbi:MAG: hypothetical protein NE330_03025 [Lentisphaeraceae bacterium]|nr:hypothetical protein [Lentisphaeraceae bacterium]